jgi:hypothetical protein
MVGSLRGLRGKPDHVDSGLVHAEMLQNAAFLGTWCFARSGYSL